MADVVTLHRVEPVEIFQSGLENASEIEAVAASVLWKDGRTIAGWSNIDVTTLARLVLLLDERPRRSTVTKHALSNNGRSNTWKKPKET